MAVVRDVLALLREREIAQQGARLQQETGLAYVPIFKAQVRRYVPQPVDLASGRVAMLDNGRSLTLVPWRPALARRLGHTLTATSPGGGVQRHLDARQRGLQIG
jgi:hypothetical protein